MENKIENGIKKLRGNYFIIFILATGFLVTGIVAFVLQAIVFALVRPWSLKSYRKISYYFSALMYSRKFKKSYAYKVVTRVIEIDFFY